MGRIVGSYRKWRRGILAQREKNQRGYLGFMAKNNFKKTKPSVLKYPWEVLEPVRKYLADRLVDLEKKKKAVAKADPFGDRSRLDDNAAIDADAAEQVGHMQVSAIKQVLDRSIIQVRKAMTMVKLGKYGVCENCGKMIDTDRLMIMPEATLCVDCEKKREK